MTQETKSLLRSTPPPRSGMDPATVALHDSIDENIRRLRRGYLSPDGESVTVDLIGSALMVKWQERKAASTFLSSLCWSELPQVYGRYGGESGRELVKRVKALERAEAAVVVDSGMGGDNHSPRRSPLASALLKHWGGASPARATITGRVGGPRLARSRRARR